MPTYIFIALVVIFVIYALGGVIYRELIIEKPSYTVVEKKDGYEIRKYNSYITASYTGTGSINNGFMNVAGYIFGGNISSQKIAMTSPVIESDIASEKIAMTSPVITRDADSMKTTSFVLPSEYTLETLPAPTNKDVVLEEVSESMWAVRIFSGRQLSKEKEEEYVNELMKKLERDLISYTSMYQFAYYDPPSTLPFLRRNEVWVAITENK